MLQGCAVNSWGQWPPTAASVYTGCLADSFLCRACALAVRRRRTLWRWREMPRAGTLAQALPRNIDTRTDANDDETGIDLLCDLLFLTDLPICFMTAKWVMTNRGREEWKLVSDLVTLRRMYMWESGQFWIDIAGCIPWQVSMCAFVRCSRVRLCSSMRAADRRFGKCVDNRFGLLAVCRLLFGGERGNQTVSCSALGQARSSLQAGTPFKAVARRLSVIGNVDHELTALCRHRDAGPLDGLCFLLDRI